MVKSEANVRAVAPAAVRLAPLPIVTAPVKVFKPVAFRMFNVPLVPLPTIVVPETVHAKAPSTFKAGPSAMVRLPDIILAAPSVQVLVPEPDMFRLE